MAKVQALSFFPVSALRGLALLGISVAGLLAAPVGAQTVTPIPRAPIDSMSTNFSVTVNGVPVDVAVSKATRHIYTVFTLDKPATVKVTCDRNENNFKFFPDRYNRQAVKTQTPGVKGATFTFTVKPGSRVLLDYPNNGNRLHLWADSVSKNPVPKPNDADVINVTTLGIASDGTGNATEKLQQALRDAAARGKILYFPPGHYRSGTLYVPSNSRIYLAPGSLLQSVRDIKAFPLESWSGFPGWFSSALLYLKSTAADTAKKVKGDTIRNVKIWGHGTLDGLADYFRGYGQRPERSDSTNKGSVLRSLGATDVEISDIILRNSPECSFWMTAPQRTKVRRVKIMGYHEVWADGLDFDGGVDLEFQDVFIANKGDDAFCMKNEFLYGWALPTRNIRVNNLFATGNQGVKMGWRAFHLENAEFSDIYIYGGTYGLGIEPQRGARARLPGYDTEYKTLKNVLFKNVEIGLDVGTAISFNIAESHKDLTKMTSDNVKFVNVNITKDIPSRSTDCKNVEFVNVNFMGKLALKPEDMKMSMDNSANYTFKEDKSIAWAEEAITVSVPWRPGQGPSAVRGGPAERGPFQVDGRRSGLRKIFSLHSAGIRPANR